VEYQQIAAVAFPAAPSTDALSRVVLERWRGGQGGLVFGTLLGPEATGPWPVSSPSGEGGGCGTCVSGFLAAPITRLLLPFRWGCVWGVWYGVVV
jgi:hypothetical protein